MDKVQLAIVNHIDRLSPNCSCHFTLNEINLSEYDVIDMAPFCYKGFEIKKCNLINIDGTRETVVDLEIPSILKYYFDDELFQNID